MIITCVSREANIKKGERLDGSVPQEARFIRLDNNHRRQADGRSLR